MAVISVSDLRKKFGSNEVVKGVTFTVEEGEVFGFLGKNGAGKSTMIHILTGIMFATSGSFTLLDKSGDQIDEVKQMIGVMPDAANFYADMTAMEHMRYFADIKGITQKESELTQLLHDVGLGGDEKKKVGQFSFGMKQKLGIAQALIGEPKLVFLDEPTSGVDAESSLAIHDMILRLQRQGLTIFMTSHNMNEVEKLCTRIAILQQGVIAEQGTMEEIRARHVRSVKVMIEVPNFPIELLNELRILLGDEATHLAYDEDILSCELAHKSRIPSIHYWLAERRLDVYQLRTQSATLEEILMRV